MAVAVAVVWWLVMRTWPVVHGVGGETLEELGAWSLGRGLEWTRLRFGRSSHGE